MIEIKIVPNESIVLDARIEEEDRVDRDKEDHIGKVERGGGKGCRGK